MNTTTNLVYLVIKLDAVTWQKCSVEEFNNYMDAETAAQLGNAAQDGHKYIVVNPISL
jgi:hypothetical protein